MISYLRGLREKMTPLLQVSQWEDHAKLTANEFVCAGDYLISNDPTWKWAATMMKGDNNTYEVDYLPSSKQYIYNESLNSSIIVSNSNINNQWCLTEAEEIIGNKEESSTDEWEVITKSINKKNDHIICNNALTKDFDNLIISITYDRYYRCPRMFIEKLMNNTNPIHQGNIHRVMQLIKAPIEYVNESMTFECHPFHGRMVIAVHPCLSCDAIKYVINNMKEKPKVHLALVLFLKSLNNILPSFAFI